MLTFTKLLKFGSHYWYQSGWPRSFFYSFDSGNPISMLPACGRPLGWFY